MRRILPDPYTKLYPQVQPILELVLLLHPQGLDPREEDMIYSKNSRGRTVAYSWDWITIQVHWNNAGVEIIIINRNNYTSNRAAWYWDKKTGQILPEYFMLMEDFIQRLYKEASP